MYEIRLTSPDGSSRNEAFRNNVLSIGRDGTNDVAIAGGAVSSKHCRFDLTPQGVVLHDLGSRNGTYVNNQRVVQPVSVRPGDRIFIGSFLVEVVAASAAPSAMASVEALNSGGSLLRDPGPNRKYRDLHGRYLRYAEQWERDGRPAALALKPDELKRAQTWLGVAQPGMLPEVTRLQREFIEASAGVVKAQGLRRTLGIVGGVVGLAAIIAAAVALWPESDDADAPPEDAAAATTGAAEDDDDEDELGGFDEVSDHDHDHGDDGAGAAAGSDDELGVVDKPIEHKLIPFETLEDVARRYDVGIDELAAWNFLNPDDPNIQEGKVLTVKSPGRRPLPQQRITYAVEKGETAWSKLANRFDVPVTKLQAYNPDTELKAGTEVVIYIDPVPHKPRLPRNAIPEFTVDKRATSIGLPNSGSLVNGIQMPESPLYTRKSPRLMYGSSQTISNLQKAIATFRQDVDYEGALILSDISKQGGGKLPPHKSHQAGRDIDIWLPTIKGVYKKKHLGNGKVKDRRPLFDEVDWHALWGLVRALIRTGAVQYVFLDWRYQEFVYRAAVEMGATEEELDEWIQWPRRRTSTKGIFRHSQDHLSHIHVRFKCAPWEPDCKGAVAKP